MQRLKNIKPTNREEALPMSAATPATLEKETAWVAEVLIVTTGVNFPEITGVKFPLFQMKTTGNKRKLIDF